MLSVTELRKGTVFVEDNSPFVVLDYRHIKMARGSATIKVKVKNLKSGSIVEKTFTSGASVEEGEIVRKKVQYLYSDEDSIYFMDPENFEQSSNPVKIGEEALPYLKEGREATLAIFENAPVSIEVPLKVNLKVTQTPPGNRGDTKQGGTKEAMLETGLKVQVPMFVKAGDMVRINTQTGEYVERVLSIR
jgi:elongation factor P